MWIRLRPPSLLSERHPEEVRIYFSQELSADSQKNSDNVCKSQFQILNFRYFERQLELASSTQLPLFLHCRSAANDLIEILKRNCDILPRNKGVIHSFDGSYEGKI